MPQNILVLGNLDLLEYLKCPIKKMFIWTLKLLEKTAAHKNFIISSGCDLPPGVPLENVNAFYKALDSFNKSL